jgi:hypothetical protein
MMQLSPGGRTPPIKVKKNQTIICILKKVDYVFGVRKGSKV